MAPRIISRLRCHRSVHSQTCASSVSYRTGLGFPKPAAPIALLLALLLSVSGCTPTKWTAATAPLNVPPTPIIPREFRGVWVASVANLDWPSRPGLSPEQQRTEITALCDRAAACGANAVLVQVRPSADAIYPSRFAPWSTFVVGTNRNNNGYDALEDWVSIAHSRGLEFHAWLNPFRAKAKDAPPNPDPAHVIHRHPDWVRAYAGMLWLDPSEPAARQQFLEVVREIITKYPVDGIHIDDYFYPYPNGSEEFDDARNYAAYRNTGGQLAKADWRRWNVDQLVYGIYQTVKAERPAVRVGVSPFGIWRPNNPPGVKGLDAYNALSADARRWLAEGWVDYLAPQLYWSVASAQQPFAPLLEWWLAQNTAGGGGRGGRYVWPGLNASKYDAAEISRQIDESRRQETGGHILYALRGLSPTSKPGPAWAGLTLVPPMPWIPASPLEAATASITEADGKLLIEPEFNGKYIAYLFNQGRWNAYVRWGPVRVPKSVVIGIARIDASGIERRATFYMPAP